MTIYFSDYCTVPFIILIDKRNDPRTGEQRIWPELAVIGYWLPTTPSTSTAVVDMVSMLHVQIPCQTSGTPSSTEGKGDGAVAAYFCLPSPFEG